MNKKQRKTYKELKRYQIKALREFLIKAGVN
jgi:hypothetical protein